MEWSQKDTRRKVSSIGHAIIQATFYGMMIIEVVISGRQVSYSVLREKICELNITSETKILSKNTVFQCIPVVFTPAIAD